MSRDNRDFLDDMMDINRDGKVDSQDMFLNYMIYNENTKNDGNKTFSFPSSKNYNNKSYNTGSTSSNSGCSAAITFILVALAIIGWLTFFGKACDNKKSSYSYTPRHSYSTYSSRSYSSNSDSYYSYSSSSNNYPSKSYGTYSRSNSYKSGSDPYNAKNYYDAEDFYEDYYDDFDDFEDAEDYFDEYGDH